MGTTVPAGRGEAWLRGSGRAVAASPRSPEPNAEDRHAHEGPRRQRAAAAQVGASSTTSRTGSQPPDASVLTEYRGLTVTDLANLRAALRPGRDRLQDLQEHARPPGRRPTPGFTEIAELLEGPVAIAFVRADGDAVTAAKALRDFAKTQPEPRREGRDARRRAC